MSLDKLCMTALLSCALVACGGDTQGPSIDAVSETVVELDVKQSETETMMSKPEVQVVVETLDPVLARGKRMFLRCQSCHTVNADGKNGTGPNIHGIFGAEAAKNEGFKYSKAMEEAGMIWTHENLDVWIEKPRNLVPGTSMAFVGIRKAEDREALIAYLEEITN